MKISYAFALAVSVVAAPAIAQPVADSAATAPAVSKGATVFSADGRRVGRIERVRADSISLIYNGKFIEIPTSTLSAGGKGYTTSLSKADLSKL